jgi:hypothetical protein
MFLLKKLPPYATYGFNLCMQLHYHIWMKRWCLYATPTGHIVKICKYKFGNPAQLAINTLYEEVRLVALGFGPNSDHEPMSGDLVIPSSQDTNYILHIFYLEPKSRAYILEFAPDTWIPSCLFLFLERKALFLLRESSRVN